jgi:hypothetical protein
MRVWTDLPCFAAWKAAKSEEWCAPADLSPDCLTALPPSQYVSLVEIVDMLAFGAAGRPIGLDALGEQAARFRAGLAVLSAARKGEVSLIGRAGFRLPHVPGGMGPVTALMKVEWEHLEPKTLVIDGGRDWIGPTKYADEYPEHGQAPESVTFVDVAAHRDSLRRWLTGLSIVPPQRKRGPKPKFDWAAIETEAVRLMDYHGDFSADDAAWNAQARLESGLLAFCGGRFSREPGLTQLRTHLATWLKHWRTTRK